MERHSFVRADARAHSFTLLELLVVLGILAILLVAIVPAINSLSKSSGRKAAIGNLLGAVEQARAEALKSGVATYVVLPADVGADPNATQRYSYRSYAIFEDNPPAGAPKQLTAWRTLPTGISVRSKTDSGTDRHGGLSSLPTGVTFHFQPTNADLTLPYIKFNASGEIEEPSNDVLLVVFEGSVSNGAEMVTGAKDNFGNPIVSEALNVSRLTGRAQPTATPTPSS